MRKKTVLAVMCVCAVLFSGCEKTPENVIVREKGKQSIQKYESGESAGGSLAEQLEAPQHYSNLVSYEIGDVQTEHVKLMDFDSVINIYEQMMEISNADLTEWEKIRTYHIRKITVGYTRIYNPEADSTSGILVPVWDFFGEFDSETDEETEKRSGEHSVRSMMTINAIDGSLIDRELGY